MDALEGGFVIHKSPAILAGFHKHTLDLDGQPVSQFDLEATNRLQSTPWTVNRRVLEVARALLVADVQTPLVPGNELLPVPGRLPDEVWAGMDEADRRKHVATISRAHAENASRAGRRKAYLDELDTATEMEDVPRFWFPWTHDFRLRRYPIACGALSPQGSDLSKSLLMFANGKPLGESGFYWLCVRLANAMGQDKLPLDDRFVWAHNRLHIWEAVDADPIKHIDEWVLLNDKGEVRNEPWGALATIFEIADAELNQTHFISHLPIPMDGSCNGLQHLSAMGLDPVGAAATNLTASDARQDVYLQVAAYCVDRVETDAAKGLPEALLWLGKVGRDTVKRAVLATPYGVTDAGIQKQLLDDRKVPYSDAVSAKAASAYFRDVLVDALSGTVVAAKQIMAWLQACGTRLAEAGLPMEWTTPTGSTIRQAYHEQSSERVCTLVGRIALRTEVADGVLAARKQALGSAPNIVHSFDASHLAMTTNTLGRHYDIVDFAMIHDSYGVHACDTPALHAVLRAEFVALYSVDRLRELRDGFRARAPHVDIPEPPTRGSFDLEANVPNAPFFFA